jgi:hypothetical protein
MIVFGVTITFQQGNGQIYVCDYGEEEQNGFKTSQAQRVNLK